MPEVFAFAIAAALPATGAVAFGTVTYAAILGYLAFTASLVALSYLLQKRPVSENVQSRYNIRQSDAPRLRGYGLIKTSGVVYFYEQDVDRKFYVCIALHSGQIDGIERVHLDGQGVAGAIGVTDVAEGVNFTIVVGKWRDYTHLMVFYGSPDQTSDPSLLGIPVDFATIWTDDHRLRGIAHMQVRIDPGYGDDDTLARKTANGIPRQIVAIYRASRVYDMRASGHDPDNAATWAYSDNPALCILDFLRHSDGGRRPLTSINVDSFETLADICDELVDSWADTGSPPASGPDEPRYRLCGAYTFDEDPREVLARMLVSCDSELYIDADGKIAIRHNEWTDPALNSLVVIDEDHIITAQWNAVETAQTAINELHYKFRDPINENFEMVEGPIVRDAALIAERGETLSEETEYDMVPSGTQAYRLATRKLRRRNPPSTLRIVTDAIGLMAMGEQNIRVVFTPLEIDGVYKIVKHVSEHVGHHEFDLSEITEAMFEDVICPTNPSIEFGLPAFAT